MSNRPKKHKQNKVLLFAFVISATVATLLPFLLLSTNLPALETKSFSQNGLLASSSSSSRTQSKGVSKTPHASKTSTIVLPTSSKDDNEFTTSCALCFFGLPRSFKLLVLPSIVKNILIPNMENNCDVFLHYYHVEREGGHGRSGIGGSIDPNDVQGLHQAVQGVYSSVTTSVPPHVSITNDTDQTFWKKRSTLLEKYRTTKGADGKYLYFPWMAKTYTYPTSIDNIVKQWHSIDSVWNDMEDTGRRIRRNYTRVAMLRNDVVYVTPFDIYRTDCSTSPMTSSSAAAAAAASSWDHQNQYAIVPNWARFPINDRMIYGPHQAVSIWATERFTRLEDHVRTYPEPGYGMHSERFLDHSIFPAIRNLSGVSVIANPDLCFFRARADGSVWNGDCATRNGAAKGFRKRKDIQELVESIVGRPCRQGKLSERIPHLLCGEEPESLNDTIATTK